MHISSRTKASRWLDLCTFGPKKGQPDELLNTQAGVWFIDQVDQLKSNHKEETAKQLETEVIKIGEKGPPGKLKVDEDGNIISAEKIVDGIITYDGDLNPASSHQSARIKAWLNIAFYKDDQLSQRLAYALSQVFVVSDRDLQFESRPLAMANYYDILCKHVFGSYRELLKDITLSPVMGHYLTMVDNHKDNPDENYAREIMQLFTMGLHIRNDDGTFELDASRRRKPCYTEKDIQQLARIFTGWTRGETDDWESDMIQIPEAHDNEEKILFNDVTDPANTETSFRMQNYGPQSFDGDPAELELEKLIDSLIDHPSTAPNFCYKLIQLLVASNPSPDYVSKVVSTFKDSTNALEEIYGVDNIPSGEVVKGNLKAVFWSILTYSKVYTATPREISKVREPWLALVNIYRALDVDVLLTDSDGNRLVKDDLLYNKTCNQYPLGSPSVFNFYLPDYKPKKLFPEGEKYENIQSPELQIIDWSHMVSVHNHIYSIFNKNFVYGTDSDHNYLNLKSGDRKSKLINEASKRPFVRIEDYHNALTNSDGNENIDRRTAFIDIVSARFFHFIMPTVLREELLNTADFSIEHLEQYSIKWTQRLLALALTSPFFHVQQNIHYFPYTVAPADR
ncbi:DUF1800 family protein [Enterovibrio norvegicus]|uniref:DUF1800 domain-containing protein n=1 Tax=Enterovibrio norvegicus TaxID=188144 RepID=A0A2N7LFG3_9GAMM|nr:DUF1800 family protein [Enterovibrio norvegicus]PMN94205.1 hypothetical protein BCT23_10135 [Enterovibrio norvegicus]